MPIHRANVKSAGLLFTLLVCLAVPGTVAAADQPLDVTFFFTPACRMCKPTKEAVRAAEQKYGDRITVEHVDLSHPHHGAARAQRLFKLLDRFGVTETPSLAVFAGNSCLSGGETIIEQLDTTLARELAGHGTAPEAVHVHRMGFWTISLAALADGVNPCAFATMVLLVSLMASAKRTRRQTLATGITFTAAVYITYFAIGLALFGVLARLQAYTLLSDLVFYAAFAACVVFGILSFHDATLAWRGRKPQEMLLKLPDSLRERMRVWLRSGAKSTALLGGVFVAGVVVSLLESACTGQVYVPVINAMVRDEATRAQGLKLLAWYNLLFVLPLVGVFGLTVLGVHSQRLAAFGERRWGETKLALGLVFVIMAIWMAPGLVWPPGTR
jgi:hypothetical protein